MPELPDVVVYIDALTDRIRGRRLDDVQVASPFVLRSVAPPLESFRDAIVREVSRIGKRIVLSFGDDRHLVLHLMIAGRLRWRDTGEKLGLSSRLVLARLLFEHGVVLFTEAGSKKRASLTAVAGAAALAAIDRGGLDPLTATPAAFAAALSRESHTVKRALTDPRLFSGLGNAYSDEILHAARLSPLKLTRSLTDDERTALHAATVHTLQTWIERLRVQAGGRFPEKVTAFHPEMAVHGRFGQPCPDCASPVQRIVYADNECNYCARCQTGGRLLADRSLSRLLKGDWPRSLDER